MASDRLNLIALKRRKFDFAENIPIPEVKAEPFVWSFDDAKAELGKKAFRFASDPNLHADLSKIGSPDGPGMYGPGFW